MKQLVHIAAGEAREQVERRVLAPMAGRYGLSANDEAAILTLAHQMRERNRELEAFIHIPGDAEISRAFATAVRTAGPLAAVPVGVKDIFDTADMPTAYGSRAYEGHRPALDSALVDALRALGAVVMGKTATTEFAAWPPARTRNPARLTHTPGGSSAGSAAAVAVGLLPVAFGTQTLGSVIRPASFCGTVGFKPTYGRLSRAGVKPLAESLDTIGLFTRSVADARSVYEALVPGQQFGKRRCTGRLGFLRGPNWHHVSPDAQAAIEHCINRLRAAGMEISDAALPASFEGLTAAGRTIHDYEMRAAFQPEYHTRRALLSPSLVAGIETAARWTADDHARALDLAARLRAEFAAVMAPYDALLCVAANGEAPSGLESTGDPVQNIPWTVLHAPAITIPALRGATQMPIGLQIVSDRFDEMGLLETAEQIEQTLGLPGAAKPDA